MAESYRNYSPRHLTKVTKVGGRNVARPRPSGESEQSERLSASPKKPPRRRRCRLRIDQSEYVGVQFQSTSNRLKRPRKGTFPFALQRRMVLIMFFAMLLTSTLAGCNQAPDSTVPRVVVFAASSTASAMTEIAQSYRLTHGVDVQLNFAASSTLARQIGAGAACDIYLSANSKWADFVMEGRHVKEESCKDLLANRLALIVPAGEVFACDFSEGYTSLPEFNGHFSLADPDHVPAGIYGKEAMIKLGWWDALEKRTIRAQNVMASLVLVERGEAGAGIVYASNAARSPVVTIAATLPRSLHSPILYPALRVSDSPEAGAFFDFLDSPEAHSIFLKYGFEIPAMQTVANGGPMP